MHFHHPLLTTSSRYLLTPSPQEAVRRLHLHRLGRPQGATAAAALAIKAISIEPAAPAVATPAPGTASRKTKPPAHNVNASCSSRTMPPFFDVRAVCYFEPRRCNKNKGIVAVYLSGRGAGSWDMMA